MEYNKNVIIIYFGESFYSNYNMRGRALLSKTFKGLLKGSYDGTEKVDGFELAVVSSKHVQGDRFPNLKSVAGLVY